MHKLLALLTTSIVILSAATFNVSTTLELRAALKTATSNREDNTIILADGTYKTTDDGKGTFIYSSNDGNKLILKGSNSKNVILSGNHVNQILNHQSNGGEPLVLENLSFVDGNNTSGEGGGVYTNYSIRVKDCNFTNNSASYAGGGFSSEGGSGFSSIYGTITVTNSTFTNNSAKYGGGFSSDYGTTTVSNSSFTNNSAKYSGGGFSSAISGGGNFSSAPDFATVTNSTFTNNSVNGGGGYSSIGGSGFSSSGSATVTNSTFTNNSVNGGGDGGGFLTYNSSAVINSIFTDNSVNGGDGGGFSSSGSSVVANSIFTNNSVNGDGGGFCSGNLKASNLLLRGNSSGIYIYGEDGNAIIANSIFLDNNTSDINALFSDAIIFILANNYIDTSRLTVSMQKKSNNIFAGVNLGFADEANGDYHLIASSDLIDAGSTSMDYNITFPIIDFDGNARIVGPTIDIGPYEFSSTGLTINSITFTGEPKESKQLTFNVDYTLANSRTIDKIEYDYENSGTWTTLNTHTYNTKGIYTINVKVTDSDGEFSTTTRTVNIAELPFSEMTDAQKLKKAIDPQYYDEIMKIINSNATLNSLTASKVDSMQSGWTLSGTSKEITDMSIFDNASIIWVYNNSAWSAYSSNATMAQKIQDANIPLITSIPADSGVWVYK